MALSEDRNGAVVLNPKVSNLLSLFKHHLAGLNLSSLNMKEVISREEYSKYSSVDPDDWMIWGLYPE